MLGYRQRIDRQAMIHAAQVGHWALLQQSLRVLHVELPEAEALTRALVACMQDSKAKAPLSSGRETAVKDDSPSHTLLAFALAITSGVLQALERQALRMYRSLFELLAQNPQLAPDLLGLNVEMARRILLGRQVLRFSGALQQRAQIIADEEAYRAAVQGMLDRWRNVASQDAYLLATAAMVWVAIEDERTCPDCVALDGTSVPVTGQFVGYGLGLAGPPLHRGCRCALAVIGLD